MTPVSIDPELKIKCSRAALGCVAAEVRAGANSTALETELRACEERIAKLPEPRAVLDSPVILATRAAYKALGKDPARYRGSAEALLRRIIAGKGLPRVSPVVDIINLVSVESRFSIGLYDLAHVQGEIIFRKGRPGETYKGIGKYDLNLEDLPLFADDLGPHGSPTSDSERTMVTAATKNVLAILISFSRSGDLEKWSHRLRDLLVLHAAAQNIELRLVT